MAKTKSKEMIYLQLIIGLIAVAWFSYDFFHTLFNGMTYTLRFDNQISISQNAFAFSIAVIIKLAVFTFFIWLVRDCFKKLKS